MPSQREQAEAQFRTANLWNFMNVMKRNSDVERAVIAKDNGMDPAQLQGFLAEIPFGNQTIVSQAAEATVKAPSSVGNFTKGAVLALAAGAAGFGLSQLNTTPEPLAPPPVNAVLEWEITPDGQSESRSVSRTEHGIHTETRTGISGGDTE